MGFASIVSTAFGLPLPPPHWEAEIVAGGICAITGEPLTRGYRLTDVVSKTESNPARFYPSELVAEDAARLYAACNPRGKAVYGGISTPRAFTLGMRALAVFDGQPYEPLLAREAASEQKRACWSDLVRAVWPSAAGKPCAVLLSTDFKTRVWNQPHVRAGILGNATPVVVYDPPHLNRTLVVNWPVLLRDLDFVETLLGLGFWQSAIDQSLWRQRGVTFAPERIAIWEKLLETEVRISPHYPIIKIIARAKEIEKCLIQRLQQQPRAASRLSPTPNQLGLF